MSEPDDKQQAQTAIPFDRFAKFTERARKALSLAQKEAHRLGHNYIGTEHLLLGLILEGEGVAARALRELGADLNQLRAAIEHSVTLAGRRSSSPTGEVGLTPRAKKAVALAMEEARVLQHRYVGTEHVLLGIVREGEGIGGQVLASFGITIEPLRAQIMQILASLQRSDQPIGIKNNVVTCRLDDRTLDAIDALVETSIRTTRSDAAAWLITAGIEAHRTLFERVYATVAEIRQLRAEAQAMAQQITAAEPPASESTPPNPPEATT